MRPCKISEIEMPFALHVNFHSINANFGTCENALAPKKWGRREQVIVVVVENTNQSSVKCGAKQYSIDIQLRASIMVDWKLTEADVEEKN